MREIDLTKQHNVLGLDRKSKIKHYLRLFFDLFDMAANNSYTYIVYKGLQ